MQQILKSGNILLRGVNVDELFFNINTLEKHRLLKILEAHTMILKKNNLILSSVKHENIICILITGHLQIVRTDYYGNRTIIEDLKENSIFGSMISSISNTEYDVLAKEDAQIVIIDFNEIINYNEVNTKYFNQFLKNLLKIISQKIQENNERIEILTNKTIRDKLLAYFRNNTKNSNNRIVYLPFTLTDLADYLAVNRSAMSRELKNLKDEGFIEIKNKKIKLLFDADIN